MTPNTKKQIKVGVSHHCNFVPDKVSLESSVILQQLRKEHLTSGFAKMHGLQILGLRNCRKQLHSVHSKANIQGYPGNEQVLLVNNPATPAELTTPETPEDNKQTFSEDIHVFAEVRSPLILSANMNGNSLDSTVLPKQDDEMQVEDLTIKNEPLSLSGAGPDKVFDPTSLPPETGCLVDLEECLVCSDSKREVLFGPCCHVMSCKDCSAIVKKCILCKQHVLTKTIIQECSICSDGPARVLFLPCRHMCACKECSARMKKCIQCHRVIEQKVDFQVCCQEPINACDRPLPCLNHNTARKESQPSACCESLKEQLHRLQASVDRIEKICRENTLQLQQLSFASKSESSNANQGSSSNARLALAPASTIQELDSLLDSDGIIDVLKRWEVSTLIGTLRGMIKCLLQRELAVLFSFTGLGAKRQRTKICLRSHKLYTVLAEGLSETSHKNFHKAEYDNALKHILKNCTDWNGYRAVRKRPSNANNAAEECITTARSSCSRSPCSRSPRSRSPRSRSPRSRSPRSRSPCSRSPGFR